MLATIKPLCAVIFHNGTQKPIGENLRYTVVWWEVGLSVVRLPPSASSHAPSSVAANGLTVLFSHSVCVCVCSAAWWKTTRSSRKPVWPQITNIWCGFMIKNARVITHPFARSIWNTDWWSVSSVSSVNDSRSLPTLWMTILSLQLWPASDSTVYLKIR